MRISEKKLKKILNNSGLKLKDVLEKSGISKTAYYSILHKDTVLPNSVHAIANVLQVSPLRFLEDRFNEEKKAKRLLKNVEKILKKYPHVDRDNIRHTLLLLNEPPLERLRRSLRRGQARHS